MAGRDLFAIQGRDLFATDQPAPLTPEQQADLPPLGIKDRILNRAEEIKQGFGTKNQADLRQASPFTPEVQERRNMAEGIFQSGLKGATLGFSDEIQSVIAAAFASPSIPDKTFMDLMLEARTSYRDNQKRFEEENPKTALAAEVAGGLGTGLLGAGKAIAAKGLAGTVTEGIKAGVKIGGAEGIGNADAESFVSPETVQQGLEGTIQGAAFGGSFPLFAKALIKSGQLIPADVPKNMLLTALKFKPSLPAPERLRAVNTALNEGIMPTVKGLQVIANKIQTLDIALQEIIDSATARGVQISKKAVFTELKKLRQDLGGVKLDASRDLPKINAVARSFDKHLDSIKKQTLTPREMQDLKRSAYQRIKFDFNQQKANFAEVETKKAVVRGARKSLERLDDDVSKINQREGDLLQLGDELEQVVGRLDNRNFFSLDTAVKIGAGSAAGPGGAAIGTAAAIGGAPRVKAKIALILHNRQKIAEIGKNSTLPPEILIPLMEQADKINNELEAQID